MVFGAHDNLIRGGTDEWVSPPHIIKALGAFDLDPCAPVQRPWPTAQVHYDSSHNGLEQVWSGKVWLNPPYSQVGKWVQRLAEHGDGVALIFARTETRWFQRWVFDEASSLLFIAKRLYFHHINGDRARGPSGAPSVLAAYGLYCSYTLKTCSIPGKWVNLK